MKIPPAWADRDLRAEMRAGVVTALASIEHERDRRLELRECELVALFRLLGVPHGRSDRALLARRAGL
jgi:hypothetical protein